jgi:hypothetical protein
MVGLRLDIFQGRFSQEHEDVTWVECVEGSPRTAVERMKVIAEEKPGAYFVFDTRLRRVLAEIDTTDAR